MKFLPGLILALGLTSSLQASTSSINESWESISDPEIMSYFFSRQFHQLPLEGEVTTDEKYWSGSYWPLREGNINFRWNGEKKIGFGYHSPTMSEAMNMGIPGIAKLSPTEKYDLYIGRYDYPLKKEVDKIADPTAQGWEGICHGWAPASMNHLEPRPKLMRNPDGIEIPFGSSDIKALLSYYYAYGPITNNYQIGRRCFSKMPWNKDPECNEDLNAGAFHLILANRIGIKKMGFIADLQRYEQVWNYPVMKYRSKIVGTFGPDRHSASETAKVYRIQTTISYVSEGQSYWQKVKDTVHESVREMTFLYQVEVDGMGNIVGGHWLSRKRPDFLWLKLPPETYEGNLSRLNELLDD